MNRYRSNFDAPTELLLRRVLIQTLAGVTLELAALRRVTRPSWIGNWRFHASLSAQLQPLRPSTRLDSLRVISRANRRRMLLSCPLLETSLGVKVAGDLVADSTAQLLVSLGLVQQCKQSLLGNDSATSKFTCEYQVLLARGGILCDSEVMRLEAQPSHALSLAGSQVHQTPLPALRKGRSVQVNWVSVVAETFVKG